MGLLFQLDGILFGFLLLSSSSSFSISSGSGRTEFYFPTFAKPCPLVASVGQTLHSTTIIIKFDIK
jgi:hypothetical protein